MDDSDDEEKGVVGSSDELDPAVVTDSISEVAMLLVVGILVVVLDADDDSAVAVSVTDAVVASVVNPVKTEADGVLVGSWEDSDEEGKDEGQGDESGTV